MWIVYHLLEYHFGEKNSEIVGQGNENTWYFCEDDHGFEDFYPKDPLGFFLTR